MQDLEYYEIINPSDKAFFAAPTLQIAALVTLLLGNGQYAAKPETEGAPEVPMFFLGGVDEWWAEHCDGEPLEGAVGRHNLEIAKAMRTVCYGDLVERKLFDSALAAIDDPEKRAAFIAEWNDKRRTSLNDIMGRAHDYADALERLFTDEPA